MINDIACGGLKMPHLESIIETQKIMWVKRFLENDFHPWKEFLRKDLYKTGGCDILNRKIPEKFIKNTNMSDFSKQMLECWNNFQSSPSNEEEIENQFLWYNTNIKTPSGNILYYPRLQKKGILYIKDIIFNKKIMQINQLNNKKGRKPSLLHFNMLLRKNRNQQPHNMYSREMEKTYF